MSVIDWIQSAGIAVLCLLEVGRRFVVMPRMVRRISELERAVVEAADAAEEALDVAERRAPGG